MNNTVTEYVKTLRDTALPIEKLKEILNSLHGHIHADVETDIRNVMSIYERNITSLSITFPCQTIAKIIDKHAIAIATRSLREKFLNDTKDIILLVHQYRNGLRGYMRTAIHELLHKFYDNESQFESNDLAQSISLLQQKHGNNNLATIGSIFAYMEVTKRSCLIVTILEHLQRFETGLIADLAQDLNQLTLLSCSIVKDHTRVAFKASQLLLAVHQPSYEIRHRQMESILLRAVRSYEYDYNPVNLSKLVRSELPIFDVLPSFFYHTSTDVRNAALEVYIRRSYVSCGFDFFNVINAFISELNVSMIYFENALSNGNRER